MAYTSSALAVTHATIWSGARIEMAPTCVQSRPFEALGDILRVLVYYRDPFTRKSQELVDRGLTIVCFAIAVSGVVIAACEYTHRLATFIPRILSYRTLSSDYVTFLLKCSVTPLVLS
jgi:hypothetical protein